MSSAHLTAGRPWTAQPQSPGNPSGPWVVVAPPVHGGGEPVPVAFFLAEEDARAVASAYETVEALMGLLSWAEDETPDDLPHEVLMARAALEKAGRK